jgi:hypothetical protein
MQEATLLVLNVHLIFSLSQTLVLLAHSLFNIAQSATQITHAQLVLMGHIEKTLGLFALPAAT